MIIRQFEIKDYENFLNYLDDNYESSVLMYQGVLIEEGQIKGFRPGVEVYLYLNNEKILGILMFLPNSALIPHIIDESIVKKYDLLKLLRDKSPNVIKGEKFSVDVLNQIIQNFRIESVEKNCTLFECTKLNELELKNKEEIDSINVDDEYNKNYNNVKDFLIEYEKSFGKNPISINEQRKKINSSFEKKNHILIADNDKVIGRAAIDFCSQKSNVISGIYISERYRNKGIGKKLTYEITKLALRDGKNAMLTVLDENHKAINIYMDLGYKKVSEYKIITMV